MLEFEQLFDSNVYFTSDTHFNHKNICAGTSSWTDGGTRDFATVEDMNVAIIESINAKVPANGVLFHMGDFNFGDKTQTRALRERINCREIHLIYGNHDRHIRVSKDLQSLFSSCQDYAEILVLKDKGYKQRITLAHYPHKVWNKSHKGAYILSGHCHGSLPYTDTELGLDVGWDIWKQPISFDMVREILRVRIFKPVDHHNEHTN